MYKTTNIYNENFGNVRTIMNFHCQVTQYFALLFYPLLQFSRDWDICPPAKRSVRVDVDSGGLIQPVNTLGCGTLVLMPCIEKISVAGITFCVLLVVIDPSTLPAAICIEKVEFTTVRAKNKHRLAHENCSALYPGSLSLFPAITVKIKAPAEIKLLEFLSR